MAIGWFVCRYKRVVTARPMPARAIPLADYQAEFDAAGAVWAGVEVLGNYAICKVRGPDAVLDMIAAAPGFIRLPLVRLDDTLATLTQPQRNALATLAENMGYTTTEIASLGNLRTRTLGELLLFMASRRHKPRYDAFADEIVLDGEIVACESLGDVDLEIQEL